MEKIGIPVSFSDLTYTKQGIATHSFPLGISYVAAYAQKKLGIDVEIFKYHDDFANYLEKTTPKVACFSSYVWNNNLAYAFAERIKKKNPDTIIVFGGPNYPIQDKEQGEYLSSYPAILKGALKSSRIFLATFAASSSLATSSRTIANSSLPSLNTASTSRNALFNRSAVFKRIISPAVWPRLSFIFLNLFRSSNNSARIWSLRLAWAIINAR